MAFFVPPGGFAGFAQMTPASKRALTPNGSRTTGRRRKRKATKAKKRRTGGKRKPAFGTPAWQKKYGNNRKAWTKGHKARRKKAQKAAKRLNG